MTTNHNKQEVSIGNVIPNELALKELYDRMLKEPIAFMRQTLTVQQLKELAHPVTESPFIDQKKKQS